MGLTQGLTMNDLVQQAQHHAARCEHHARLAAPKPGHFGWSDEVARASSAQLASFHALKAFELSAQAARVVSA